MLARLKRLLGVNGSSHGGETSFCPMSQELHAGVTWTLVDKEGQQRGASWKIYVPLSDTIEVRDFAGRLLASFSPSAGNIVLGGSRDPKPPV
jgi:hypothetical protein